MVRHPVDRLLSHYLHNVGGGYESRELADAVSRASSSATSSAASTRSSSSPFLEAFDRDRILVVSREELGARARRDGAPRVRLRGVDEDFTSPEFDREWETGSGKGKGGFRAMDRAVRMPGLRALDRNFDRLPERMRWMVERLVHDPDSGEAAKPELQPELA